MSKLGIISLSLLLAACGGSDGDADENTGNGHVMTLPLAPAAITDGDWSTPAPGISWQWQLSGTVNDGYDVTLYDIDLFDSSSDLIAELQQQGRTVICYFSAGSYEDWRDDESEFNSDDLGDTLDGWPGERWLDIRSQNVQRIMLDWIRPPVKAVMASSRITWTVTRMIMVLA